MDRFDNKVACAEIAAIKIAVPAMACRVVERAMQVHRAAGLGQDVPLAAMNAWQRSLKIIDGPDEVHRRTLGRVELATHAPFDDGGHGMRGAP